jgi:hypothetical protein
MNSYFVRQHISLSVLNITNGTIFFPVVHTSKGALLCLQVSRFRTAGLSEKATQRLKSVYSAGSMTLTGKKLNYSEEKSHVLVPLCPPQTSG